MMETRLQSTVQSVIAILTAACFLAMNLGYVSRAAAADSWETWPRKTTGPGEEQNPVAAPNAADKGWETWPRKTNVPGMEQIPVTDPVWADQSEEAAGKKLATGRSYGTIGWIALGIVAVIGIGIAAGGGGGGGGTVTNPGHQ